MQFCTKESTATVLTRLITHCITDMKKIAIFTAYDPIIFKAVVKS